MSLYQALLLEHGKRPRNFGPLAGGATAQGANPLCGDEIAVHVRVEAGRVEAAAFEGAGCAVCLASASMMTQAAKGRTPDETALLAAKVAALVEGRVGAAALADLGDLAALEGVARFPARRKCALLAWRALAAALSGDARVSTE